MTNLSLVSIEDIVDELKNRYDHFVFSGIKELDKDRNGRLFTERKWHGNSAACCGLCHQLQQVITNQHFEDSKIVE